MRLTEALICVLIVSAFCTLVYAGSPIYDRTIYSFTHKGTWTNTVGYAALELKNVSFINNKLAVDTNRITRVTRTNVAETISQTQDVSICVMAASTGYVANITTTYMKPSDMLMFSNYSTSGGVAVIEYEVQQ